MDRSSKQRFNKESIALKKEIEETRVGRVFALLGVTRKSNKKERNRRHDVANIYRALNLHRKGIHILPR